jgi:hypothetical protein
MTDGKGKVTRYHYGEFGLLLEVVNAANKPLLYRYDFDSRNLLNENDKVKYVGRTRQDLKVREKQHQRSDIDKKNLHIKEASLNGKPLIGLNYSESRGLEQMVYENHKNNGNKLLNKIRPLDIDNPKKAGKVKKYLEAGLKFIGKVK